MTDCFNLSMPDTIEEARKFIHNVRDKDNMCECDSSERIIGIEKTACTKRPDSCAWADTTAFAKKNLVDYWPTNGECFVRKNR